MPKNQAEIALILQSCLEAIQKGEETVDSVLDRYPHLAEVLKPQLETALWVSNQSHAFDPKPEFITASRLRIVRRIEYAAASTPSKQTLTFWAWLANLRQNRFAFQFALTLLLVMSLVFSTNRLALAANHTLPGDFLYPVKITHENARLWISFTPENDVDLHTGFARQRLVEIEGIILEGRYDYIPQTVEVYEHHIARALAALKKVIEKKSDRVDELAAQLYRVLAMDSRILGGYYQLTPQSLRSDLNRVTEISEDGLSEMAGMKLAIASIITTTPAATNTPMPGIDPGETHTATATLVQTNGAEETLEVTPTSDGTLDPKITSSPTQTPRWWVPPSEASPTSPPLSATATPTSVTQPPPTAIPIWTSTAAPTSTATPSITNTPVPPTPVPSVTPVCNISGVIFEPGDGVEVVMDVSNNSGMTITITAIEVHWPQTTPPIQRFQRVFTNGTIWVGDETTSPTVITNFVEGSESLRQIQENTNQNIRFRFFRNVESSGYQITINFDNGCSVTDTK